MWVGYKRRYCLKKSSGKVLRPGSFEIKIKYSRDQFQIFLRPIPLLLQQKNEKIWVTGHRALDTGQFRFWSKIQSPFFCSVNGPVRSFGIFYATFEKKLGFFIPSVKKVDLKNRKNEKMAQNGQF